MKKYKVLKGKVGGFGNKTHEKGSEVTADMFPKGNAEKLEEMGFLKGFEVKETEPNDNDDNGFEPMSLESIEELGEKDAIKELKKIKNDDLVEQAKNLNVNEELLSKAGKKAEYIDLIINAVFDSDSDSENSIEGKTHEDFDKDEIIDMLKDGDIEYNPLQDKEELFDLLK